MELTVPQRITSLSAAQTWLTVHHFTQPSHGSRSAHKQLSNSPANKTWSLCLSAVSLSHDKQICESTSQQKKYTRARSSGVRFHRCRLTGGLCMTRSLFNPPIVTYLNCSITSSVSCCWCLAGTNWMPYSEVRRRYWLHWWRPVYTAAVTNNKAAIKHCSH